MSDKTVFTVDEVAELLSVDAQAVRDWCSEGELKAADLGEGYRIRKGSLETFWQERGGDELFEENDAGDMWANPSMGDWQLMEESLGRRPVDSEFMVLQQIRRRLESERDDDSDVGKLKLEHLPVYASALAHSRAMGCPVDIHDALSFTVWDGDKDRTYGIKIELEERFAEMFGVSCVVINADGTPAFEDETESKKYHTHLRNLVDLIDEVLTQEFFDDCDTWQEVFACRVGADRARDARKRAGNDEVPSEPQPDDLERLKSNLSRDLTEDEKNALRLGYRKRLENPNDDSDWVTGSL